MKKYSHVLLVDRMTGIPIATHPVNIAGMTALGMPILPSALCLQPFVMNNPA
jgi:hypothetical protein